MFVSLVSAFRRRVVVPVVSARMNAAGKAWVAAARQLCPVDTGNLRDSLGYTFNADTMQLKVYSDANYALFVEFGHRTRSGTEIMPQPFMRPALHALSAVWKGSVTVQASNVAPKYHARIKNYKYRLHKGMNLQVGRSPFA